MHNYVLVIGASHLDILADYEKAVQRDIDKIGRRLRVSIGGTGYNIASNLAKHGQNVELISCVRTHSLTGHLLREKIRRDRIRTKYFISGHSIPEAAYVAHRIKGAVQSAVSLCSIDHAALALNELSQAIKSSRRVVADTNLSKDQLTIVIRECAHFNRPLSIACVSEGKVKRLVEAINELHGAQHSIDFVSMNRIEAEALEKCHPMSDEAHWQEWASKLCIKFAVVTYDSEGYAIVTSDQVRHFPAPQMGEVISETGAGDATHAGVIEYLLSPHGRNEMNWVVMAESYIRPNVVSVLAVDEATVGASSFPPVTPILPRGEEWNTPILLALLICLITCIIVQLSPNVPWLSRAVTFFLAITLAGIVGDRGAEVWDRLRGIRRFPIAGSVGLGAMAGLLTAFLWLVTNPNVLSFDQPAGSAIIACVIYAVGGGITISPIMQYLTNNPIGSRNRSDTIGSENKID